MELYSEVDITGEKNTMFFLSSDVLDNPLPKIPDAIRRSVKQQQRPNRRMVLGPGNSSSGVGTPSISLPVRRIRCLKAKKKRRKERVNQGTRTGVPLTYVYPNGIYGVLWGFLGIITHKFPLYRACIGISHRGIYVGIGVHPTIP